MDKMKDVQRQAWQITLNNPLTYGWTHEKIKETLITQSKEPKYFCMADEIGQNGTPHTHIYVYFQSRVRFSTVKKRFPEAHIEAAIANIEANIMYIKKSGKWSDTDKAETSIEGTFEEWGERPTQKGTSAELEELFRLIKDGYSNTEILEINNDYILNVEKIDRIRTMLLIDENKSNRRTDLRVIYISGATGTGKTRNILDEHGDGNVYRVTNYNYPFDSYSCQPVLLFEEFRSSLKIGDMLNYLDIYPIELPARYANKFACYNTVYITTNWRLEEQYRDVRLEYPETWNAFLRRIHEVRVYNEDGTITTYDSAKEYMNRNNKYFDLTPVKPVDTDKLITDLLHGKSDKNIL